MFGDREADGARSDRSSRSRRDHVRDRAQFAHAVALPHRARRAARSTAPAELAVERRGAGEDGAHGSTRSYWSTIGCLASATAIGGAMNAKVHLLVLDDPQELRRGRSAARHEPARAAAAPGSAARSSRRCGRTAGPRSPVLARARRAPAVDCTTFATRLRWLSRTPLGDPVVPEEYGSDGHVRRRVQIQLGGRGPLGDQRRQARMPGRDVGRVEGLAQQDDAVLGQPGRRGSREAAAATAGSASSATAPLTVIWWATSSAVASAGRVVAAAPARRMPWNATPNSGLFGACRATTCPGRTPRAARAPAVCSTCSRSSPKVTCAAARHVDEGEPGRIAGNVVEPAENIVVHGDVRDLDRGKGLAKLMADPIYADPAGMRRSTGDERRVSKATPSAPVRNRGVRSVYRLGRAAAGWHTSRMDIDMLFAGTAVGDFDAAVAWYTAVFGRAADVPVAEGEVMWRFSDSAFLYLVREPDRAGGSLLTLSVADLDLAVAEVEAPRRRRRADRAGRRRRAARRLHRPRRQQARPRRGGSGLSAVPSAASAGRARRPARASAALEGEAHRALRVVAVGVDEAPPTARCRARAGRRSPAGSRAAG